MENLNLNRIDSINFLNILLNLHHIKKNINLKVLNFVWEQKYFADIEFRDLVIAKHFTGI